MEKPQEILDLNPIPKEFRNSPKHYSYAEMAGNVQDILNTWTLANEIGRKWNEDPENSEFYGKSDLQMLYMIIQHHAKIYFNLAVKELNPKT